MSDLQADPSPVLDEAGNADGRSKLLVTGGMVGSILASTCCILPLVLVLGGVSGAWIGQLKVLEPYNGYITAATLIILGIAFWQVYFKRSEACEDGTYCARPQSSNLMKAILWVATCLVLATLTVDWWAPFFY